MRKITKRRKSRKWARLLCAFSKAATLQGQQGCVSLQSLRRAAVVRYTDYKKPERLLRRQGGKPSRKTQWQLTCWFSKKIGNAQKWISHAFSYFPINSVIQYLSTCLKVESYVSITLFTAMSVRIWRKKEGKN